MGARGGRERGGVDRAADRRRPAPLVPWRPVATVRGPRGGPAAQAVAPAVPGRASPAAPRRASPQCGAPAAACLVPRRGAWQRPPPPPPARPPQFPPPPTPPP